jgi:phospholipid-binding lipoprotein MlaA
MSEGREASPRQQPRLLRWLGLGALLLSLLACASGPQASPHDPLEPFNRGVFKFNDALDVAVVKPMAVVYRDHTPTRLRQGITNVFDNLEDVWSTVNNALQLKGRSAVDSLARVVINTVFGIGGVIDVASEMEIERHTKDFGHTLGFWGVPPGPYLVLPLLGPSSLRDTVALPVDWQGDLVTQIGHVPTRNTGVVVRAIDNRADLLKATSMLDDVALDRYTFTRDAYLQRRRNDIFDGNPPDDTDIPAQ